MTKSRHVRSGTVFFFVILIAISTTASRATSRRTADLFSYEELVELYEHDVPSEELLIKLQKLLTTPFVNNQASANGTRALKPNSTIGRVIRIAHWNIERGLEYEALESAFTNPYRFLSLIDHSKAPAGSRKRAIVLEQLELLGQADVIVLNEIDWGMKRTDYRNVVKDLAGATKMNYAYGTEFVEIDPIALGSEKFEGMEAAEGASLSEQISIDPERYKGLHGTAILSRFPLSNVRLVPFRHQGHDWYKSEKKGVTKVEKGKRKASELVFRQKIEREVRRGGRMMLLADIEDPEIPSGRLTVVATHLESKTKPRNRLKQLEELLETIREIDNPVIVAGDMNTSTQDGTPTSLQREIKKRFGSKKYLMQQAVKTLAGLSLPNSLLLGGLNEYRKQADPTVRSVHFVASNPESRFFDVLKKFRFADGGAFDFRGDRRRSIGNATSPLANSNQRGAKGFVTTFEVERTIGFVGKFKLDWIFVKPPKLTSPYDKTQSFVFAPHFGRTLKELNHSIKDRISDHDPIIVDLTLTAEHGVEAQD